MRTLLMLLAVAAMAVLPAAAQDKTAGSKPAAPARSKATAPSGPVNINTATQTQLEALPGLGAKVAERIMHRPANSATTEKAASTRKAFPSLGPSLASRPATARMMPRAAK